MNEYFLLDCAESVSAPTQRLTADLLGRMLDDPRVAQLCSQISTRVETWHPGMTTAQKHQLKEAIAPLKKQLPGITPHAHFPNGKRSTGKEPHFEPSGLVCMDYDELDDPRQLWHERIEPHIAQLRILLAFVSPSTHGLKVLFAKPDNLDIPQAQLWFNQQVDMTADSFDPSGKDYARFCFISPRPYVLYLDTEALFGRHEAVPYVVEAPLPMHSQPVAEDVDAERIDPQLSSLMQTSAEGFATARMEDTQIASLVAAGYHGIPYADILSRYWELNNEGREPEFGDRNTKIFELAMDLRHITSFNVDLLDAIIPCYCGFPPQEKRAVIVNAVTRNRYQTPLRMRAVLQSFKSEYADQREVIDALQALEEQPEVLPYRRINDIFRHRRKHLPMGVADSMDGVNDSLRMAVLIGIGPMIGALATGVQLWVHDEVKHLNLMAYIVGEAASGKSKLDPLYRLWMADLLAQDEVNAHILEAWKSLPAKEREKQKRPQPVIRVQPLRTSVADVLSHLSTAEGQHLYSFSAEADQLSQTRKSGSYANVGVLIRLAYDGAEFKSSFAGETAVNASIPQVHWNVTLCTTPDGLKRATPNVTDGEVTRLAIARTPDTTFAPLQRITPRSEASQQNILRIARLLPLMRGEVELPRLQKRCEQWLDRILLETTKDDDRVRANLRKRVAVTAMRYVCCLMLCAYAEMLLRCLDDRGKEALPDWADGASTAEEYLNTHADAIGQQLRALQTSEWLETYDVLADYLLDSLLYFYRDRIEQAYADPCHTVSQRLHAGSNDTVYDKLPHEFSVEQARQAKGASATDNQVRQMLKNWKSRRLIESAEHGRYRKLPV